ncbi:MAG TPA: hypothetical protein VI731_01665 [Bacteroidia bacterium]|nr:hypothetical protein [Bacteroidia bacterium]
MTVSTNRALLIPKEVVAELHFPSKEVLSSPEEIKNRDSELNRALVLGNVDHNKVRILFIDSEGPKMVETTIWAVTEQRIILKSGMAIPINRITEIIT